MLDILFGKYLDDIHQKTGSLLERLFLKCQHIIIGAKKPELWQIMLDMVDSITFIVNSFTTGCVLNGDGLSGDLKLNAIHSRYNNINSVTRRN